MKKILFILIILIPLLFPSGSILAQKTPEAVTKAFAAKFPKVTKVDFDKEGNGEYEAEFKENGVGMSANFSATGDWVETESEISVDKLPATVVAAIKKAHPKSKIVGAARIETASKGVLYEADLKRGILKAEVLYDENGNFIK